MGTRIIALRNRAHAKMPCQIVSHYAFQCLEGQKDPDLVRSLLFLAPTAGYA